MVALKQAGEKCCLDASAYFKTIKLQDCFACVIKM